MTIIQLEYLLAVANHGSFSAAAEHCFVTQPTLSLQIKNLEAELGVVLLDRTKQPVVPTEQGMEVLENARAATMAFNHVREAVSAARGEVSGTLSVGVVPTVAPLLLPHFVPQFRQNYPRVNLVVREMKTANIVHEMMRDALDCAIVSAGSCPESIGEQELFDDQFFAYIAPDNRLFGRTNIRVEDIDVSDVVLMAPGHCLREQVQELFSGGRWRAAEEFECQSLETLMRAVDGTPFLTIIPRLAVAQLPADRLPQVAQLAKGNLGRKIVLATRRIHVKGHMIEALRETLTAK